MFFKAVMNSFMVCAALKTGSVSVAEKHPDLWSVHA